MTNARTGTLARTLLALGLLVAVAVGSAAPTAALNATVTICH